MLEVNDQNFDKEVTNFKGITLIDFWAPWCGPCRIFTPIFEETSKEVPNAKFVKINVDEAQGVAQKFSIMSIPTVMFFKDGQPVEQMVGVQQKTDLLRIIKSLQ